MRVLVDTTIWSLALRRREAGLQRAQQRCVDEWRRLVEQNTAVMIGPIRQELLSGVRRASQFSALRALLSGFDCLTIDLPDYDQAAEFYNTLRSSGIVGGAVDLLICAAAHRHGTPVFTTDKDFNGYVKHLPVRLHQPLSA